MIVLRILLRALRGRPQSAGLIARQHDAFRRAYPLVRIFYVLNLCLLLLGISYWSKWLAVRELSPLWPVLWVELTSIPAAVHLIMTFSLTAALLAAVFPEKRIVRTILFISLLEFTAFYNSFDRIYHTSHAWLAIAFLFIFLPDGKTKALESSFTHRQLYLTAVWGALALVASFYSLAGFWKVIGVIDQLVKGEINALAPEALAYQIASRLLKTNSVSIAGAFFIDHPLIGWPLHVSAIYMECFALVAAFRPSLHRFWGLSLILLHLGSYLTMSIGFPRNCLVLFLFFVCSPFAPSNNTWSTMISDMPVLGWAVKGFKQVPMRIVMEPDPRS